MASSDAFLYFWVDLGVQLPVKMRKNLAIVVLSLLLVAVSVFSILAVNGTLDDKQRLDEENAQYEKYFSEIESWKKCVLDTKFYEVDGQEIILVSDVQSCGN